MLCWPLLLLLHILTVAGHQVRYCDRVYDTLNRSLDRYPQYLSTLSTNIYPARSDEAWSACRWLEVDTVTPDQLTECAGGLSCGSVAYKSISTLYLFIYVIYRGECVPYSEWCSPATGSRVLHSCGAILYSPQLCRNSSLWAARLCEGAVPPQREAASRARRCSGWWPGQCDHGAGCEDSHAPAPACVLDRWRLVAGEGPAPEMTCPSKFGGNVSVCAIRSV